MTDHSSRCSELLPTNPYPSSPAAWAPPNAEHGSRGRARRRGHGRAERALPRRRAERGGEGGGGRAPGAAAYPPRPAPPRNSRESSTPGIAQTGRCGRADGAGRSPVGGPTPPPRKKIKWSRPQRGPKTRGEPTAPGRTQCQKKKKNPQKGI